MARTKPYTMALGITDFILILLTGGAWLIIMIIRELYRHK